jgi:hypothetical protein
MYTVLMVCPRGCAADRNMLELANELHVQRGFLTRLPYGRLFQRFP